MSATEPPLPAQAGTISQADWQATPLVVRQLVLTLLATVDERERIFQVMGNHVGIGI